MSPKIPLRGVVGLLAILSPRNPSTRRSGTFGDDTAKNSTTRSRIFVVSSPKSPTTPLPIEPLSENSVEDSLNNCVQNSLNNCVQTLPPGADQRGGDAVTTPVVVHPDIGYKITLVLICRLRLGILQSAFWADCNLRRLKHLMNGQIRLFTTIDAEIVFARSPNWFLGEFPYEFLGEFP